MQHEGYEAIIHGIREEAEKNASEIIAEAQRQIAQSARSFQMQQERQLAQAEADAARRVAELQRAAHSQRLVREKRLRLKARETLIQQIIADVESRLAQQLNAPDYPDILQDWIVEAGLGIRVPEAIVQTSALERPLITAPLLAAAAARIKEISGRTMTLALDENTALPAQGVVLTSPERTVAFSNQVPVRLQRYQSRIRQIIYHRLYTSD
jgi:vacuolar-type H+-ATPase subunit E/Vma4